MEACGRTALPLTPYPTAVAIDVRKSVSESMHVNSHTLGS